MPGVWSFDKARAVREAADLSQEKLGEHIARHLGFATPIDKRQIRRYETATEPGFNIGRAWAFVCGVSDDALTDPLAVVPGTGVVLSPSL